MNEEQKFEVGDLVKLEGWDDYYPVSGVDYPYISFGNWARASWYSTFKHKFIKYVEKENEMQKTEIKKDMQENKTEYTFKVGDVVYCLIWGKGIVKNIYGQYVMYPVTVDFENGGNIRTYTHDGKVSSSSQRTLFFSEPKIEALTTRPFTPTLVGKKVFVEKKFGVSASFKVISEDHEVLICEENCVHYKNCIKELYILGENVVNSIK